MILILHLEVLLTQLRHVRSSPVQHKPSYVRNNAQCTQVSGSTGTAACHVVSEKTGPGLCISAKPEIWPCHCAYLQELRLPLLPVDLLLQVASTVVSVLFLLAGLHEDRQPGVLLLSPQRWHACTQALYSYIALLCSQTTHSLCK